MAAYIPFMEVTGGKDVQNGGRSILKMTTGFGLFSSLSKVKIYFFLLFTSNLSYFNSFKLPYKMRLLGFPFSFNVERISAFGFRVRTVFRAKLSLDALSRMYNRENICICHEQETFYFYIGLIQGLEEKKTEPDGLFTACPTQTPF